MKNTIVELIRRFAPVSNHSFNPDYLAAAPGLPVYWKEIENTRRLLILADPGMGKTFEARSRVEKHQQRGRTVFFIRIEKIDAEFDKSYSYDEGRVIGACAWVRRAL
jgi:hypothetical protein